MALILNIDTSTSVCSVALSKGGRTISIKESNEGLNHSILLGCYINDILDENKLQVSDLDAIAVSMGPGSYTGLRIGVSMAKGLCFGGNRPLIAVPTLKALAGTVSSQKQEDALYCPMIDARRMEVYTAFFDRSNKEIVGTKAEVIDGNSFSDLLEHNEIYFFGNGSSKLKTTLTSPHAHFIDGINTSAAYMSPVAETLFQEKEFVDVAYFEPFYLKDFIATTPKRKVL